MSSASDADPVASSGVMMTVARELSIEALSSRGPNARRNVSARPPRVQTARPAFRPPAPRSDPPPHVPPPAYTRGCEAARSGGQLHTSETRPTIVILRSIGFMVLAVSGSTTDWKTFWKSLCGACARAG